jgi:hypothetical protein
MNYLFEGNEQCRWEISYLSGRIRQSGQEILYHPPENCYFAQKFAILSRGGRKRVVAAKPLTLQLHTDRLIQLAQASFFLYAWLCQGRKRQIELKMRTQHDNFLILFEPIAV